MVRRRRYKAVVEVSSNGQYVNGEWTDSSSRITVKGHYDALMDSSRIVRKNPAGDEVSVNGLFYTGKKPKLNGKPMRLIIDELNIDAPIVCWDEWQSHSIICV